MAQTSGRAAVNGVALYYEIHGQGSPLVMLHGGVNPSDFFGDVPKIRVCCASPHRRRTPDVPCDE